LGRSVALEETTGYFTYFTGVGWAALEGLTASIN
jgi:hypothetical protein